MQGGSDASIDIPLDGEERVVRKNPSGGFFRKKSDNIKSPDELLADRNAAEEKACRACTGQARNGDGR